MRINTFYIYLAVFVIAIGGTYFLFSDKEQTPAANTTTHQPTDAVITDSTSSLPAPTGLRGIVVSANQVNLTWDILNSPLVARYRVSRNGRLVAEVMEPRFGDGGVSIGTTYEYFVQAIDTLGRPSLPSEIITIKVVAPSTSGPATQPPVSTPLPTPTPAPAPEPTPAPNEDNDTETDETSTTKEYTITATADGTFSPSSLSIRLGDSITFSYDGSGDEVVIAFSPSIGTSVKLDHERTSQTVTVATPGTYTFQKTDGGVQVGTLTVTQ